MLSFDLDSCRIAFMSLAAPNGGAVNPQFVATWGDIMEQAANLRECAIPSVVGWRPQGGYIPYRRRYHCLSAAQLPFLVNLTMGDVELNGNPVATLYVYSSHSLFAGLVNHYMNTGIPILPMDVGAESGVPSNESSIGIPRNSTFLGIESLPPPLSPGEYVLMDKV